MKKFLALVLALVMTMSLVTIGSSAAFVDADSIEYDEAVNVLASLGVIQGKGANTFDPKGGVTRAEMAKMITYIKLGVADATAFEGTTVDLTDIDGHWAEAFIKFCYVEGIIAGKGNGKFDPNANVTTAEAAKMLLVALGYNAGVQGYIGDQWKVAVVRDAYQNDLFEDIALGADKALNRDESAKLIYNTVLTETVVQIPQLNVTTGGVSITYETTGDPLLEESFDAGKYTIDLTYDFENGYESDTKEYTYRWSDGEYDKGAAWLGNESSFVAKVDYTEFVGEEVSVVGKLLSNGDYEVLGVYPTGKTKVLSDVVNAFSVESKKLKYSGKLYAIEDANGDVIDIASIDDLCDPNNVSDGDGLDLFKVIDVDGNGKYESASVLDVDVEKVTHVDSDEVLTSTMTFKLDENEVADGIAVDDYVAYSKKADGSYVVTEVEPIEAKLASKDVKNNKVEFGGTSYKVYDGYGANNMADYDAGKTYKVWAHNGVAVAREEVDGKDINNLVMIYASATAEMGNTLDSERVGYIDATGTKTEAVLDRIADDGDDGIKVSTTIADTYGQLYLKKNTSDGVEFRDISKIGSYEVDNTADALVLDDGKIIGIDTDSNNTTAELKIADDAVVFVYGASNSAKVLTGKQLMAAADGANFDIAEVDLYTKKVGLTTRVTHMAVTYTNNVKDINAVTGTEIYAYVTSDSVYDYVEDTDSVRFTVWNGTENLTVVYKDRVELSKGDVISYKSIKDVDGVKVLEGAVVNATEVPAAVYNFSSKAIWTDAEESVKLNITSDTKYLYVNSTASKAEEIGKADAKALGLASEFGGSNGKVTRDNILYVADGSDLLLVVIDVNNNMTCKNTSKLEGEIESYTDVTSVKRGDKVTLKNTSNVDKTFTNVMEADGFGYEDTDPATSTVTIGANQSKTVYVTANSTTIGIQ